VLFQAAPHGAVNLGLLQRGRRRQLLVVLLLLPPFFTATELPLLFCVRQ
jgi:hypothetical protein